MKSKIEFYSSGRFTVYAQLPETPAVYGTCTLEQLDKALKQHFAHQKQMFKQTELTLPKKS